MFHFLPPDSGRCLHIAEQHGFSLKTQHHMKKKGWIYFLFLLMTLLTIVAQASHAAITAYPPMANARFGHTSTVLGDGKVLITGGMNPTGYLTSAEIFSNDPAPVWMPTATMDIPRRYHTAVELPNGKVLIAGGETATGTLTNTARIYDRKLGTWSPAANMATARARHVATMLGDGRVLVTGGGIGADALASAEVYDWQSNAWSSAGSFAGARYFHTATRLYNGKVIVAGGGVFANNTVAALSSASLYDPASNSWTALPNMITSRYQHGAVALYNGKVLMISGRNGSSNTSANEVFDPATGTWSAVAALQQSRSAFAQLPLPDGRVMVSGGWTPSTPNNTVNLVELYEPRTNTWSSLGNADARQLHTLNRLGNGDILITGGVTGDNNYQGAQRISYSFTQAPNWSAPVSYLKPGWGGRYGGTSLVMNNGNILIVGGMVYGYDYVVLTENGDSIRDGLFTPAATGGVNYRYPTLTMLNNGRLLMSGAGVPYPNCCSHLYPVADGNVLSNETDWSFMKTPRYRNEAILLKNGKVLAIGGNAGTNTPLAEIFDPAAKNWTATGPNLVPDNTASALLSDGQVLVTATAGSQRFTWIYDPYGNTWRTVPNTTVQYGRLTTLPNGKVLAAGGNANSELFDPDTQSWSAAGTRSGNSYFESAVNLANGDVLLAGASTGVSTAIYRFASNDWVVGPSIAAFRGGYSSTMMENGKFIMIDGGPPGVTGTSEAFSLNYNY